MQLIQQKLRRSPWFGTVAIILIALFCMSVISIISVEAFAADNNSIIGVYEHASYEAQEAYNYKHRAGCNCCEECESIGCETTATKTII